MRSQHPAGTEPELTIRRAEERDVPDILDCLAEAFEPFRASYTAEAFRDTVPSFDDLRARLSTMCAFVAVTRAGDIVGTVACSFVAPGTGHLRGMAVRSAWRRSGVASELIRVVESEVRGHNCSRITLNTTPPLTGAMRFYETHGFRRSGTIRGFFGMPLIEHVKELDSPAA